MDFCCHQGAYLRSWVPTDVPLYQALVKIIVPALKSKDLEIADMAIDALPSLFPDITQNQCKCIAKDAEEGVEEAIKNILENMIIHNAKNPEFKEMLK